MARCQALTLSFIVATLGLVGPALGQPAAAPEAVATVPAETAADPWLSEDGPPVPRPAEEPRPQVVEAWRSAPATPRGRVEALRRVRLELGLGDLTAPALAILREASEEDPQIHAQLARELAPGVPAIQWANAQAFWAVGETGPATQSFVRALMAILADFGAQLWLLENLLVVLLAVVIAASLAFMVLAAIRVSSHAAHDLGDLLSCRTPGFARAALLAAVVLAPLALGEGVLGFSLVLFILGFAYGKAPQRSVLALAAVLLVIGLHPLSKLVSLTTEIGDRDPIAESAMAVVRDTAGIADVERLEAAAEQDDLLAAHALVLRARRLGLEEQARERLDAILERHPMDVAALTARANIEMRRGRTESAIELYERAAGLRASPTLLFDLSQAYARDFRMEEYERTLARAQALGDREVAELSRLEQADLVADPQFPSSLLLERFRSLALHHDARLGMAEVLAPGRLGERWFYTAGAFGLAMLLCLLFANRFDHSSVCVRCGQRICTRCQETVWSEEVCEGCHHLFRNPEATDPSLRRARLQALATREARLGRLAFAGSLLVPGAAGFAAGRPDFALFGLLLFGWALGWLCWPSGVFVDPLMMGAAATVCFAIPGVFALLAYVGLVARSLWLRRNL